MDWRQYIKKLQILTNQLSIPSSQSINTVYTRMATAATNAATATKVKCKYWDNCYRKDPNHNKEFLHPADVEDKENNETSK